MKLLKSEDILHKAKLLSLLTEIVDNNLLAQNIYFKGGTCATMLGYLDRFSVDLDFDLKDKSKKQELSDEFKVIFDNLNYKVEKANELFYILKYDSPEDTRNSLKLSVTDEVYKSNDYKIQYLPEIDRNFNCQTIETMFANKLVAIVDRYVKHKKVAGRDIYDAYYFFSKNYEFNSALIKERTGKYYKEYFLELIKFIEEKVSDQILDEDLNMLLPLDKFHEIRKTLKRDVLIYLRSNLS